MRDEPLSKVGERKSIFGFVSFIGTVKAPDGYEVLFSASVIPELEIMFYPLIDVAARLLNGLKRFFR